jgi:hypothetical protein
MYQNGVNDEDWRSFMRKKELQPGASSFSTKLSYAAGGMRVAAYQPRRFDAVSGVCRGARLRKHHVFNADTTTDTGENEVKNGKVQ